MNIEDMKNSFHLLYSLTKQIKRIIGWLSSLPCLIHFMEVFGVRWSGIEAVFWQGKRALREFHSPISNTIHPPVKKFFYSYSR